MMIEQGGIQFLSLKGSTEFVGFNVTDDAGNDLTVKLSIEQVMLLAIESAKILVAREVDGVTKTEYFGGDKQYTINDY